MPSCATVARRVVADVPARLDQAPDQVDVLAAPQRRIEEVGASATSRADEDRCARDVGDPAHPVAPGPRRDLGRATTARPGTAPAGPRGRADGTIRGATAATRGSSKWPRSGSSHPSARMQSESTKATMSPCCDARQPGVARHRRTAVGREPDEHGAVLVRRSPWSLPASCRCVVDDDARQRREGARARGRAAPAGHARERRR